MIIKKWLSYIVMGIGSLMVVFWLLILCMWFPFVMLPIGMLMVFVGYFWSKTHSLIRLFMAYFIPTYNNAHSNTCSHSRDNDFIRSRNILNIAKRQYSQNSTHKKKGDGSQNN